MRFGTLVKPKRSIFFHDFGDETAVPLPVVSADSADMRTFASAEGGAAINCFGHLCGIVVDGKVVGAKQIAAAIVREANEEAQRVLDDANEEANRLLISAEEQRCMTKSPLSESQLKAIETFNAQLDALNVSQATQIFRLKQAILKIAADEA